MKKETYNILVNLWSVSIGITFVFATFLQSREKYYILYQSEKTHFFFAIILLIMTFVVFFMYAIATKREMIMLKDYLNEKRVPRLKTSVFINIFGLAIIFGFLISFSDKIFNYCIVLILLKLMDIYGDWQVLKNIKPLINKELRDGNKPKKELDVILIINKFYFDNPTILREIIIYTLYWIGLCFALAYTILEETLYQNISYLIIVMSMLINEVIIQYWRMKRDKKIYLLE